MAAPQPAEAQGKDPVRGRIVQHRVIPAQSSGAVDVARGQVVRIVDVEGQQVPDVLVYDRHNLKRQLSMRYSLIINGKVGLSTGDTLYDLDCEPVATIVADTVGKHWWGGAFCSEALHAFWRGKRGLPGCRENLARALEPYGLTKDDVRDGGCLNLFMNFQPGGESGTDGLGRIGLPFSQAGDYLELRAERDLLVAISACPDESAPTNGYHPTPIGVVVYEPATG
jgi:uncharacterized protein YcgI (DUF1989 family)